LAVEKCGSSDLISRKKSTCAIRTIQNDQTCEFQKRPSSRAFWKGSQNGNIFWTPRYEEAALISQAGNTISQTATSLRISALLGWAVTTSVLKADNSWLSWSIWKYSCQFPRSTDAADDSAFFLPDALCLSLQLNSPNCSFRHV
jgi:hypothetical protein